jgi:Rieske Fe-S protein
MAVCEMCGNDYDKAFDVVIGGETHTFDSFECAIHSLAPTCEHCGCRVIGHGVESDGRFFCCAHCATQEGVRGIEDRV